MEAAAVVRLSGSRRVMIMNQSTQKSWEELLREAAGKMPFKIGQTVYLTADPDQLPGIIDAFMVTGRVSYRVGWGNRSCTWHHDFELSAEKKLR